MPTNTNTIGLDVGIKYFLVGSNDKPPIENPKYLYKYENKLRKAQRAVSRKKKGSANRKKAVAKLARVHLKIRNTRKDFQHKISTVLIRENQTIIVEKLLILNLLKNHNLAKSISDAAWGSFFNMLEYKSKWYGRNYVEVAPQHTSQDCSVCGERNSSLTLAMREWTCPNCGTLHCRDKNAAKNIENKGVGHTLLASQRKSDVEKTSGLLYKPVGVVGEESPYL